MLLFCQMAQAQVFPDFTKMNFGCDGNSITAGNQWSKTVVETLGFATHHNVAVGSATWAAHHDTQDYSAPDFLGISGGWMLTKDSLELRKRHNNNAKVHIQKFIAEVDRGLYFVCTPIQTANTGHNEANLKKIEILKEICRSLSVQLIDCYSECGITEKLENGHGQRYLRDGLHPAEKGQQLMGRYIAKEIRNNYF